MIRVKKYKLKSNIKLALYNTFLIIVLVAILLINKNYTDKQIENCERVNASNYCKEVLR